MSEGQEIKPIFTAIDAYNMLIEKGALDYTGISDEERVELDKSFSMALVTLQEDNYWEMLSQIYSAWLDKKITGDDGMKKMMKIVLGRRMRQLEQVVQK